jgi:hypothetical protein
MVFKITLPYRVLPGVKKNSQLKVRETVSKQKFSISPVATILKWTIPERFRSRQTEPKFVHAVPG